MSQYQHSVGTVPHAQPPEGHGAHHELGFIRKYIFSMDHKVIAVQFLFTALLMLVLGGLLALAVRWQLAWPFDAEHPIPILSKLWEESGGIMPSRTSIRS